MATETMTNSPAVSGWTKIKVAYVVSTGLLTLMMLGSAGMYIFNNAEVVQAFTNLGFPTWIIYPLATAKLLGLVAIWSRKSKTLLNLAYAGFFYNFILASSAHIAVADGEFFGALMALVLLGVSFFSQRSLFSEQS